jgi:phosphatidylserine/phosphatidylglycerophosphate/cardiolipin synthase-like enzyme
VDLKDNPLLLLCVGFLLGIVLAESVYYVFEPMVLSEGSVQVLNDRDYFPAVDEMLSKADDEIYMVMFSMNYQTAPEYSDSNVNSLVQKLVAAKNNGVDVRVIMDDWYDHNMKTAAYLEKNNVPVKTIRMDGSTHCKLIIIDGETVVVGSTNWSYHALDKNHEANAVINDAEVANEFRQYFQFLSNG